MKKLTAILILLVFSFNLIGYKYLFDYLQYKNDIAFESDLDKNNYDEKDLIVIHIPFNLPYQTENTEFERVNGEITKDGIYYKYVKRKIENGEIILMCIPDENKSQLVSGKDEFFKLANDFLQIHPTKHSTNKTLSIFKISLYDTPLYSYLTIPIFLVKKTNSIDYLNIHSSPFINYPEQPPELA